MSVYPEHFEPLNLSIHFKHFKHFKHSERVNHSKRVKHFEPIGQFYELKEIDLNALGCMGR